MHKKFGKYLGIIVIGSLVLLWIGCSNTSEIVSSMDSGQIEASYNEYSGDESQQTDEGNTSENTDGAGYTDGTGTTPYDGRGTTVDSDDDGLEEDED